MDFLAPFAVKSFPLGPSAALLRALCVLRFATRLLDTRDSQLAERSNFCPYIFDSTCGILTRNRGVALRHFARRTSMPGKLSHPPLFAAILLIILPLTNLNAQQTNAAVTGTVTSATGTAVPNAKVTAKNLTTSETTSTQSDTAGHFHFDGLAPADYEISASADAFESQTSRITVTPGASQTLNLALTPAKPESNLPNAPSSSKTEPSLSDLGFTPEQTQGNAKQQALLDKRTHMLKVHQKLGLITTAPLIATIVTSLGAGGKHTSTSDRTAHLVLGAVSGDLYFITAYYAIRAPRVPE